MSNHLGSRPQRQGTGTLPSSNKKRALEAVAWDGKGEKADLPSARPVAPSLPWSCGVCEGVQGPGESTALVSLHRASRRLRKEKGLVPRRRFGSALSSEERKGLPPQAPGGQASGRDASASPTAAACCLGSAGGSGASAAGSDLLYLPRAPRGSSST